MAKSGQTSKKVVKAAALFLAADVNDQVKWLQNPWNHKIIVGWAASLVSQAPNKRKQRTSHKIGNYDFTGKPDPFKLKSDDVVIYHVSTIKKGKRKKSETGVGRLTIKGKRTSSHYPGARPPRRSSV